MQKAWASKKGFTVIELLVVIVVIGVLAGIMIISYTGIQQRSRDSERDSEITQIKIALEKYHADKSSYPGVCSADNTGCSVTELSTELKPYLDAIPHDPRFTATGSSGDIDYMYVRRDLSVADGYALRVSYEAKNDCKTGVNIVSNWWGADIPSC